jgi:ubiquinone/menaquinone biosynthesis C-methylase UbiE
MTTTAGQPGGGKLGEVFLDEGVARAYRHRPPYPDEALDILAGLITDEPRTVLDLGAGEGALARPLAARAARVDAVDISAAMIGAGRRRPGGEAPSLRWILGPAQAAPLDGPYALVTAGASLHWMPWPQTLGRLPAVMTPGAVLAIAEHGYHDLPWRADLLKLIVAYARSPDYDPEFSLPDELARRGLLRIGGQARTAPAAFRQSVDDYVEQFFSRSSLSRVVLPAAEAAEFGAAVRRLAAPHASDGMLDMRVGAIITWGRPVAPARRPAPAAKQG